MAEFRTACGVPMSLAYELHSIETIGQAAVRDGVSPERPLPDDASSAASVAPGSAGAQPAQHPNGDSNFLDRWPSSGPLSAARDLQQAAPATEYGLQQAAERLIRHYDDRFSGGLSQSQEPAGRSAVIAGGGPEARAAATELLRSRPLGGA